MALLSIGVVSCLLSVVSALTVHRPRPPVKVDPCFNVKCKELPPYMECQKMYTPEGQCCPVCACENRNGEMFSPGSISVFHKGPFCYQCYCMEKNGFRTAECLRPYCPRLDCPPAFQIRQENKCCKKCSSSWVKPQKPTFPPFPGGGFPGGFPHPGGFPGGFPHPGDEPLDNAADEKIEEKIA